MDYFINILKKIFVAIFMIGGLGILFILFPFLLSEFEGWDINVLLLSFVTVPFGGFFIVQGLNNILYDEPLSPVLYKTPQYLKLCRINYIFQSLFFFILIFVFFISGINEIDQERKTIQIVCSGASLIYTSYFFYFNIKVKK